MEACFITHQHLSPEAGVARLTYLRGTPVDADAAVETDVIDHIGRRDSSGPVELARRELRLPPQ